MSHIFKGCFSIICPIQKNGGADAEFNALNKKEPTQRLLLLYTTKSLGYVPLRLEEIRQR